ncbi:MAG: redoxin domain-containing protein [Bacteriovoracaceae bacterium]|jgi:cytochrome c biogenesis protein CcmG, thiol:disulfide interchange protein DsbE|nr:redoxin domain-containing protein [Bacteriovoracaceae bacterium]
MDTTKRFLIIFLVLGITVIYAVYKQSSVEVLPQTDSAMVLKKLPDYKLTDLEGKPVSSYGFLKKSKLLAVHFWGTWCAPCEAEFPEFLKFIESFSDTSDVTFHLIATQDTVVDVKKFLKRFKKLPPNIVLSADKEGIVQKHFNTIKVPETYLFNKEGKALRKFVGPQEWGIKYFKDYFRSLTSSR